MNTSPAAACVFALLGSAALASGPHAQAAEAGESASGGKLPTVTITGAPDAGNVTVASKLPATPGEIPNSISVVTQSRIEDQKLLTVADALQTVTGVTVIPNDGIQSQYRARGYPLSVMNDGVPAYGALGGYPQLDLSVYERLEVLRGPAGVLQGSAEPGGSVNLVRKHGRESFAIMGTFSAASWNDHRASVDVTGPLNADKTLRGRGVASYEDRAAFVDAFKLKKDVGYLALDWGASPATALGVYAATQRIRVKGGFTGLPSWIDGPLLNVPRSTNVIPNWSHADNWTDVFAVELRHRLGEGWSVSSMASRRHQRQLIHEGYPNDGVDRSSHSAPYIRNEQISDVWLTAADIFATGPVHLFGREHAIVVGYNDDGRDFSYGSVVLNGQPLVRIDNPDALPDFSQPYNAGQLTQTRQSGLYAQARLSLVDPLKLVLGLRASDFLSRVRNIAPSTPGDWRPATEARRKLSPYAGFVFDVNPTYSLYGSRSESFVPQSTLLRYDKSPLPAREGRQLEVGGKAQWFGGRLNASVAVFSLHDQNRALADLAHPGFYVNAGEVEARGWEAEVVGRPWQGYEVQAGYARLDTRYLTASASQQGGIFSALEPRHSLKLWGLRRFQTGAASGFSVGLGLRWQSGIQSDPARVQGAYAVASLLVGCRINESLALDFNANNLFDKTYYARLGDVNAYNTLGEPRNFSVTARASF
jgi:outer membrane receptor for ferric coprogen and ferric-rhodotorulic acid